MKPDPAERRRRAQAAFGCAPEALASGLLRFAARDPLDDPVALALLDGAIGLVAEEPELPHWVELAQAWQWLGRHQSRGTLARPAWRSAPS